MWFVFIYGVGSEAIGFHVWLRLDHGEITAGLGTADTESTQRPACAPGLTLTRAPGPSCIRQARWEQPRTQRRITVQNG